MNDKEKEVEVEVSKVEDVKWEPPVNLAEKVPDFMDIVDDDGTIVQADEADEADSKDDKKTKARRSKKRIDQLTAQKHAETRRADEAERRATAQELRLRNMEDGISSQQLQAFRGSYDNIKAQLAEAMEEGNTPKQLELTERMADMRSAARIADLQRAQIQQTQQRQYYPPQQASQEPPPQEAMTWWNKNRWFNGPDFEAESAYARVIDKQLDSEGYDKETPEYYEELNNRLQSKFPELYNNSGEDNDPRSKSKPPTAPSRSKGRGKGSQVITKDGRLRFTKAQLTMAKSLGLQTKDQLVEYAKELQSKETR
jgi:hypothetical protein